MNSVKGKRATIYKRILDALLVGGALVLVLSSPVGLRRLARVLSYNLNRRHERQKFWWTLAYLRRKHYISYHQAPDGAVTIRLTEDGEKRALRYKLETLTLVKPPRWDGKWRIIAFDIPEKKRAARNALRDKMKKLGCIQLQKSLWAWPYECKDEIDFVAEIFGVGPYVHYLVVESITSEKFLKYRFKLA